MPDIFIAKDTKKPSSHKEPPKYSGVHKTKNQKEKKKGSGKLNSHGITSAFCYKPKGVDFETREKEEKVLVLLRRHPITNLRWIFLFILMLFGPSVLGVFPILSFMPDRFQFIAVLAWYLITVAFALENFLSWFFNANILTDERVIDIDFYNLIYKEVSDANIDDIQDVTYKMGGAIRTMFNYGDVLIQTAGEVPNFEFLAIPKPAKVAKILQELRTEEEIEKLEGRIR
jgi:hypothetical protein